ncbi:MAG: histone deacetylase family protein [Proteobacteria bacterium]|nr:histone deacetylase family protein [Pseudomonadota bacterium]MDA1059645.1 histone deacetylase family protein [Pseudomonadota bacterium]
MIRFRRIFDPTTGADERRFTQIREIFDRAFPAEREAADRIEAHLRQSPGAGAEFIVLVAEDDQGHLMGFSATYFFPDLRLAYLFYIASDPDRASRGIGGAVYEAMRELLIARGAKGLFLDAGPDDPALLKDRAGLAQNRQRLRFYERYGAFPVEGTLYEQVGNPANEGYRVFLLLDSLGRRKSVRRADARKFLQSMFKVQYGQAASHPYVRQIVNSFHDDPVKLRPARYLKAEPPATPRTKLPRLRPLALVVSERHRIHHLREKGYVERPVRIDAVLRGLESVPYTRYPLRRFGDEPIRQVHDPRFVAYLASMSEKLGPKELLYPEVFPVRRPDRRPKELKSRAGYYCMDTFTPLTRNVFRAAKAAVDCALTAADLVLEGERMAYALCRPPGHHAEPALYGGFCYFNNAAVAAHWLSYNGKVAVLDIDYHHGNGTQEIFYTRRDVYTASIHGTPYNSYPHFAGFVDERGEGEGKGFNKNYPLPRGVTTERYLEVLEDALKQVRRFAPKWFVVSLGYDIMSGDPTGSFLLDAPGMRSIGEMIGRMGLPTLVVQEGGYSVWNLRQGAQAFFTGLTSTYY